MVSSVTANTKVGGWVQVSLGIFFLGKSSQNSSKPVLIFWSRIPCVFCLYMHCYKLLVIMIWVSFHVTDEKVWMEGGWVGWAPSNFVLDFFNFFNFAKPLSLCLNVKYQQLVLWQSCRGVVIVFTCYITHSNCCTSPTSTGNSNIPNNYAL